MLFAGLPGNPNAALVTFRQIALPAIRTIAGLTDVGPDWSPAVSGFAYEKRLGRTEFVPVRIAGRDELGRPVLDMLGRGSSASLMAMASACGIAMLPPDVRLVERGLPLRFEFLLWPLKIDYDARTAFTFAPVSFPETRRRSRRSSFRPMFPALRPIW